MDRVQGSGGSIVPAVHDGDSGNHLGSARAGEEVLSGRICDIIFIAGA
jgi:hypothetical protein